MRRPILFLLCGGFGLLQEGLGPHFNGPRWGRESAGLQVQGFLCSEYPVEVGLHPGLELGFAFFCRWHFFHPGRFAGYSCRWI